MFAGKARAYPSEAPFRGSTLGWAPALLTNIRPCWKGLPETKTLAFYEKITAVILFVQAPGIIVGYFGLKSLVIGTRSSLFWQSTSAINEKFGKH
jgi:hypothetical protein